VIRFSRANRRRRRDKNADDGGFVLLESIIAMGIVTVIMAALVTLLTTTIKTTSHLRTKQEAIQLADTQIEKIRAFAPSALVTSRTALSVSDQYNAGVAAAAPPELSSILVKMATVSDQTAGTPNFPATPQLTPVGTRSFWVSTYLGCDSPSSGTPCDVSLPLRAVVAVTWTDPVTNPCSNSACSYVTSTLIDTHTDPRFSIVHTTPPSAIDVNDMLNDVGDSAPFAGSPAMHPGVGVGPFTWSATGLPPGVAMAADGVLSGKITDQSAASLSYAVSVTVVDGLIERRSASFTWTVRQPTIITPAPAPTPINTPVSLQVVATCSKAPCVYRMNANAPTGLTIDASTGLITGTPTVVGTARDVVVSITDGNGVTATSDLFDWVIVPPPSSVCVPEIALTNGSFEDPGTPAVLDGAPNWMVGGSLPLKWDTTEPDNVIELWRNDDAPGPGTGLTAQAANGGLPISAQDGYQWAELNANQTGALFQNLPTNPGVVLQWSVWHRGRYSGVANAGKKDIMRVQIGSTTPGTQLDQPATNVATGVTATDISDDATAWHLYRGFYIVPPGQTTTRFQFAAISTASGNNSIGNFIDNLSLNNQVACVEKLPDPQTSTLLTPIAPLQLTAIRGSGNYTWGGGTTLPAGLSLTTGGLITGTPTAVGTSSVKLILTDTQTNFTTNVPFTWTIVAKPTVTAPNNQTTSSGGTVKLQLTTTCLNKPCAYTMANGPAGLTVSNLGLISGTITSSAQTFGAAKITVVDADGATAMSAAFTWTVLGDLAVTSPGNQKTQRGAAINLDMAPRASGGVPFSGTPRYTFSATNLPAWLTIDRFGVISGVAPSSTESTTLGITVTITDSVNATATTAAFSWVVYSAPTVTAPDNQASDVGSSVSVQVLSTCGNSPCTFSISGQPSGLSINDAGLISGTVTGSAQTYGNVRVVITDAAGASTRSTGFTWTTSYPPPSITPVNQTTTLGSTNTNYTPASTCVNSPCTYTMTGAPTALTINLTTGAITGTVGAVAQTYSNVIVTIKDAGNVSVASAGFTWTVLPKPTITPTNRTSTWGSTNTNYTPPSTCPNGPCTFTMTGAPTALTINSTTGAITGTVTGTTQTNVIVTIKDAANVSVASAPFTWTVAPTMGNPGNQTVRGGTVATLNVSTQAAGGTAPYTYSATGLPSWLTINSSTGMISGTAPTARSLISGITVSATDSAGLVATSSAFQWFVSYPSVVIADQVTKLFAAASIDLDNYVTGGTAPYTYVIANKPSWLTYASTTHVLSGTPFSTGTTFNITVTATDSAGTTVSSAAFDWQVIGSSTLAWSTVAAKSSAPNVVITNVNLATSVSNEVANTFTAIGLPPGLAISAAGVVSGTPTLPGSYRVTVSASDSAGVSMPSASFVWQVTNLAWTTIPPQTSPHGVADSLDVTPFDTGGVAPLTYTASNLPAGLTMNSATGLISGTPTTVLATRAVTITVTDTTGASRASAAFNWAVS
jgi:type II secretory pathway pseudopilin PulG